jgi:hypothetical protein
MTKRPLHKEHRSDPAEAGESFNPAGKLDNLSRKQKREIDAQSRPNAALIHEPQRVELDEAGGVAVIVGDGAFLEGDEVLIVERMGAVAADHWTLPL